MNLQILSIVFAVLLLGMAWYTQYSKRDKVMCSFRRPNRTKVEKWVKWNPDEVKKIKYKGQTYVIAPSRVTLFWYTRGLSIVMPFWVPTIDFTYASQQGLDDNFKVSWDTPEARTALGQEDEIRALDKAASTQAGKKMSMLDKWFPVITIIGLVAIGWFVYNNQVMIQYLMQMGNVN